MRIPFLFGTASRLASISGPTALGIVVIIVALGFVILNYVAIFKIVTKAGYSGWWILIPLAPAIADGITTLVLSRMTYSPFGAGSAYFDASTVAGWFVFDGVCVLAVWVFFYIFAFSKWPVRRQLQQYYHQVPLTPLFSPASRSSPSPPQVPLARGAPAADPPPARCQNCRAVVDPTSSFCGACGVRHPAPVEVPAPATAGTVPPPEGATHDQPATFVEDLTMAHGAISASGPRPGVTARAPRSEDVPATTPSPDRADQEPRTLLQVPPTPSSATRDEGVVYCPSCLAPEYTSSAFCGSCGAAI